MDTKIQRIPTNVAIAALCLLALLIAGCELDSESTNSVTIFPASVFLEIDNSNTVEFIASGGIKEFKWFMSDGALGALYTSITNTAVAIYQNTTNTGTNLITVRDSQNDSASARIVQK